MRSTMKFGLIKLALSAFAVAVIATPASATLVSVNGVLSLRGGVAQILGSAPANVGDGSAGANALGQRGFNEVQNFVLPVNITVDGGVILAGTVISSHMIFLNNSDADANILNRHLGVQWTFDGVILGVMSDYQGSLEVATSALLGAAGTIYPAAGFQARGIESDDSYSFIGNVLTFNSNIRQPGDWIRVITMSGPAVPEPASMMLLGTGLAGLLRARKKRVS